MDKTNCQEATNLQKLLESSIIGEEIVKFYKEKNHLNTRKQKDLTHLIVDSFVQNKNKMTYNNMDEWANEIEKTFPNEKAVSMIL